jgi:hypothetical protein
MRRAGVLVPVLVLLLAGCSVEPPPGQRGYRVTYTVESPSPHYLGNLEVQYSEGRKSVKVQTPRPIRTWAIDVWVSDITPAYLAAQLPDDVVDSVREATGSAVAGYPVRCRVAVNGVEVRNEMADNRCLTQVNLFDYEGEATEQFTATTHPPELWPETSETPTPAPPTSTAPAGPRPDACRYATDDEITDVVARSGAGALYFAGVTDPYPFSCLYRFAPLPTGGAPAVVSPFTGVTVIRYPARLAAGNLDGDPVPGLPGAKRVSDQEISANLSHGALSVRVDLGSDFADRNAAEEVFRLIRQRA